MPLYRRGLAFQCEITRVSGHPISPAIVEALFGWASEYNHTIVRAPDAESLTQAEHQRLIGAIAQGNAKAKKRPFVALNATKI